MMADADVVGWCIGRQQSGEGRHSEGWCEEGAHCGVCQCPEVDGCGGWNVWCWQFWYVVYISLMLRSSGLLSLLLVCHLTHWAGLALHRYVGKGGESFLLSHGMLY